MSVCVCVCGCECSGSRRGLVSSCNSNITTDIDDNNVNEEQGREGEKKEMKLILESNIKMIQE